MIRFPKILRITAPALAAFLSVGCSHDAPRLNAAPTDSAGAAASAEAAAPQAVVSPADQAPPASQTGGFDGARAYDFTAKLVSFGPHPPDTDAMRRTQAYIVSELKSFGCAVDTDDFHASSPMGSLAMENIIAKIPGSGQGIILLLTHYDTLRLANFVGADDSGSSSGLMLEMARLLCTEKKQQPDAVWIVFLDGEEDQQNFETAQQAQTTWNDDDTLFGSRELAARLAVSGDLKRVHAIILADMIGQKNLQLPRDTGSTKWLTDLVWNTADRLGYQNVFVARDYGPIGDDHTPFIKRGVSAVDIIDLDGYQYWHTIQDTMDKLSPRSMAIVGFVILESVHELQKRFP
ncbi:MAG: M28 family peptidase [Candidatus Acidiferrales bacterium]